jgi:uracil-DNA glycosylase
MTGLTVPDGWRELPFFVQDLPRIADHLAQSDGQVLPPAAPAPRKTRVS